MKTTFKKILCTLLVVVMYLTAAPLQGFVGMDWSWLDFNVKASAEDELAPTGKCGANVYWNYNSTTGELVISGSGKMCNNIESPFFCNTSIKTVVIETGITSIGEGSFQGCCNLTEISIPNSVTEIEGYAFEGCTSIANLEIPNSVVSIGSLAFYYCISLENIIIPDSVTSIGEDAFEGTAYQENENNWKNGILYVDNHVIDAKRDVETCTIMSGVKTIGSGAFNSCYYLTEITIPDSVTNIDEGAFVGCESLDSITLPNNIVYIGECAFSNCSSLTSINIPSSVVYIGERVFEYCESLTEIIVDLNNKNYQSDENGILFDKAKRILIQYPIGNTKSSYTIPSSVEKIGNSAFSLCKLSTVRIPNGVTTIGSSAFSSSDNLTNIVLPDSITTIGSGAFSSCINLTEINIPDSITSIDDGAFAYCRSLKKVYASDLESWLNINFSFTSSNPLFNGGDLYFDGNLVKDLVIPNGITNIGNSVFMNCNSITSVIIPNSVESIGNYAFDSCDNLSSVKLGKSVKSIGYAAFDGSNLTNITIPDSVTNIDNFAFGGCQNLVNITFGRNVKHIGENAFSGCKKLLSVTIPNSVISIGKSAFDDCYGLMEIILPEGIESIGQGAFSSCNKLKNITIPNSVTSLGNGLFSNCSSLVDVVIGNNVGCISSRMFYYCSNLESITIPDSVMMIGNEAFLKCDSLNDIYYSGTDIQWNSISKGYSNSCLTNATIHYNYKPPQTSYFMVSSDQYSVDSINRKETATYKIHLLDENSDFLPVDEVIVQNNTSDIVNITTNKVSDTEIELTVEPLKDGEASISLFNGDGSLEQFFNFTVYSNTTTYRADQVPVTNEKLKTNFSRGDLTVDNFEYKFDENKGKYIATMDVYNSSGAIGVVAAYTQDGKISDIEQVDPYVPLPGDFGEFLVYLGAGAVGILKGENWNYRFAGDSQKTPIEIEVPEDGYLTVSCDVTSDNAAFIYNLVSIGVDFAFKTAEVIDVLGTDTDKLAKDTTKTLAKKVSEYFNEDSEWTKGAIKKLAKKLSKQFNMAYLEEISVLSLEMLDEMYKNVGEDFSDAVLDVIIDLTKEEIKEFGVMAAAKKLVKDKVIGTAEKTLLKAASIMFDGGSYINLLNSILGAYRYNVGTGKTMVVFKPKGEDGFICKDTIKVTSDIITYEVLLHTYIIKDTQKEDAFVRKTIYSDFNRGDGLRKEELSIDLNRIVEIHEISLWKNGQEVFDTFTATVEMNLPSYIDKRTCSIYRVEKDGTYTKLDTKIEGNKIIFETNHFSEYILTGVIEDLQETTPCDVHVYEEVRTEPSCTEEGSITYTCYCGDTYTETIEANGHTDSEWFVDKDSTCSVEGSKHIECTVCKEVLKTEAIEKLSHNYSSVVTEATCETGGYTTYTCTCGDTYTGDKTPAKGHDYAEGVCKNCGDSKIDNCSCNCHKSGLSGLIWKILRFFYKLFKINPVCGCGVSHY